MKPSIVNYSEIKAGSDFRFDAEYYHPDCLDIHQKIKSKEHILFFSKVKKIGSGKNLPQAENGNYKFIRTQNVRPVLIADTGMSSTNELEKLSLTKEGELLFVRVGEGVGDSCVITKEYSGNAVSDNVLRLEIEGINPFYCSIFFNSKIGQTYFKRNFKGTARGLISQENFKDILIPVFSVAFQEAIQNCVEESQELIEESKYAYQLAQDILLAELGLGDWQITHQLWCEKSYLETVQAGRIDAEYYQPKYDEIIKTITSYSGGSDTLGNLCELVGHPSNPTYADSEEEDKTFVVTQKHLGDFSLNDNFWKDENALYTTEEFIKKNSQYLLKDNDVLLYSVGAYIGKANIYNEDIKATIGSFLTLIRAKKEKLNPYYLMVFLNTDIGIAISKQHQRGMAQQYLYPYDIRTFLIPLLPEHKQLEIQEKVIESFELRERSKKLLEDAKCAVENAIKQDEAAAIQFLNSAT